MEDPSQTPKNRDEGSGAPKPKVGKEDLDQVRKEWGVPDKDTIAVGKTNVKGLENDLYKEGSPKVRKQAGLPTLDEAMPDREIKSPFTRHQCH